MQTQTYGGDVDKRVRIDNLRPKNMMLEKEVMNQVPHAPVKKAKLGPFVAEKNYKALWNSALSWWKY